MAESIRVRLLIPPHEMRPPSEGEHFACDGMTGSVVCGAGSGGAWVAFDGRRGYVGCPVKWLELA